MSPRRDEVYKTLSIMVRAVHVICPFRDCNAIGWFPREPGHVWSFSDLTMLLTCVIFWFKSCHVVMLILLVTSLPSAYPISLSFSRLCFFRPHKMIEAGVPDLNNTPANGHTPGVRAPSDFTLNKPLIAIAAATGIKEVHVVAPGTISITQHSVWHNHV